jgi:Flp pilus assembly pilin Flp
VNWYLLMSWVRAKFAADRGANLVEYILLIALIAMAVMAAVLFLGGGLSSKYSSSGSQLSGAR